VSARRRPAAAATEEPVRPVTLLKLGGSLITDKVRPQVARHRVIADLARQIADARAAGCGDLVVGHGSGSFGHPAAAAGDVAGGLAAGGGAAAASRTQQAAHRLHRLLAEALEAAGALPFSLLPGSFLVTRGGRGGRLFAEPLHRALLAGFVPLVGGDVVLDREQGVAIASTEQVLLALARRLRPPFVAARAIWLGSTAGVLGADGEPVAELDAAHWRRLRPTASGAAGPDVTGGIRLRVGTALALAAHGVPSWIGDGRVEGALAAALAGAPRGGTRVKAAGSGDG
jgi:isopentenyl phosphate kinase